MITENSFLLLTTELSKAIVQFEKEEKDYKVYFNEHVCLNGYKCHLNKLQIDFVNELRTNLRILKTQGEVQMYLVTTIRIFELIKSQLQSNTQSNYSGPNIKMVSKSNNEISCINTGPEEFIQLEKYFHAQYEVVIDSIDVIKTCQRENNSSSRKKSGKKNRRENKSWKDDFKECFPVLMKMKDELREITSAFDKIEYLKEEKRNLARDLKMKGIDLYDSPVNLFLESKLETYKEMLLHGNDSKKRSSSGLTWNKSKTDFLELIAALHRCKAVKMNSGDPLSRKELIQKFEEFLNMEPFKDADSRIVKLQGRNSPNSFLLKLLEEMDCVLIEK